MIRTSLLIASAIFFLLHAFGAHVEGVSFLWVAVAILPLAAAFSDGFPFHWSRRAPLWLFAALLCGGLTSCASDDEAVARAMARHPELREVPVVHPTHPLPDI